MNSNANPYEVEGNDEQSTDLFSWNKSLPIWLVFVVLLVVLVGAFGIFHLAYDGSEF